LRFIQTQNYQIATVNALMSGARGFASELQIDFTYTLRAPDHGLSERLTGGLRIPLTLEVYSITTTGTQSFNWTAEATIADSAITLPAVILFTAAMLFCIVGLLFSMRKLKSEPNKWRMEAELILQKYSNEMVLCAKPVDFSDYVPMAVREFSELLKLAVILGKHIMCYEDENEAQFCVIADDYAYYYTIDYSENIKQN
jgi:hypothetical protein